MSERVYLFFEEDTGFVAEAQDIPCCAGVGATPEEALEQLSRLLGVFRALEAA